MNKEKKGLRRAHWRQKKINNKYKNIEKSIECLLEENWQNENWQNDGWQNDKWRNQNREYDNYCESDKYIDNQRFSDGYKQNHHGYAEYDDYKPYDGNDYGYNGHGNELPHRGEV